MFIHHPLEVTELDAQMIDGKRFYKVDNDLYPSVTSVLSSLSKEGIDEWVKRVGTEEANKVKNQAASRGTKVHLMCEDYVANKPDILKGRMPDTIPLFRQIQPWLDENIESVYNIEIPLYSKRLRSAGRCDLIAKVKGYGTCIIDYKTSGKPKEEHWITNYFYQETAYSIMMEEMYNIQIDHIITLIAVEHQQLQVFIKSPNEYTKKVFEVFDTYHVENIS
jgi:ATP-dependent exoDNAse (exonuclease V) beta subunit